MAKGKKGNLDGIVRRRQLLNICRHLGFENGAMFSNKAIVEFIATKRSLSLGLDHKKNIASVLSWFHAHENDALKSPRKGARKPKPHAQKYKGQMQRDEFYKSWEWRTLRMQALKEHGARCQCCGAGRDDTTMAGNPVRICVDHIKPLSKNWDLRLDRSNLQVLCDECNQGKGAWDETDWRVDEAIHSQLRYTI